MNFSATITVTPNSSVPNVSHDDAKYLIAPIVVIAVVVLLSILVYFMLKMKRIQKIRLNTLNLYEFDSNEQEWESLTNSWDFYPNYYTNTTVV
ncbi:hypothetical protein WA026_020506 [Henosepilachna vigintioctopunctata]|uniref:Uncharacterized protein n=1 Tax=Henosepilachna vigintioctopunctata TaxID=420089 RepID=A0AAW1VGN8_9CUCU